MKLVYTSRDCNILNEPCNIYMHISKINLSVHSFFLWLIVVWDRTESSCFQLVTSCCRSFMLFTECEHINNFKTPDFTENKSFGLNSTRSQRSSALCMNDLMPQKRIVEHMPLFGCLLHKEAHNVFKKYEQLYLWNPFILHHITVIFLIKCWFDSFFGGESVSSV